MKSALTLLMLFVALSLTGCKQVTDQIDQTRSSAEKVYNDTAKQIDDTKNQLIDAKQKVDEKVQQAQDAANSIQKLVQ